MTSGSIRPKEGVNLRPRRHGQGGAEAGDGDAGGRAAEACGFDEGEALREAYGEGAVEGVAGAGRFEDGAGVEGRDVRGDAGVLDEGALRAESDDDVAGAAREEDVRRVVGVVDVPDRPAGQGGRLDLVGR